MARKHPSCRRSPRRLCHVRHETSPSTAFLSFSLQRCWYPLFTPLNGVTEEPALGLRRMFLKKRPGDQGRRQNPRTGPVIIQSTLEKKKKKTRRRSHALSGAQSTHTHTHSHTNTNLLKVTSRRHSDKSTLQALGEPTTEVGDARSGSPRVPDEAETLSSSGREVGRVVCRTACTRDRSGSSRARSKR